MKRGRNTKSTRGARVIYKSCASCAFVFQIDLMTCTQCEDRLSDYLDNALNADNRREFDGHLQSCSACSDLLAGMMEVVAWGRTFPVYEAPSWLAPRIIANTPRVSRESWLDTIGAIGKWLLSRAPQWPCLPRRWFWAEMGDTPASHPTGFGRSARPVLFITARIAR